MSDETYYPKHASLPVELLRKPEQFDNRKAVAELSHWGLCPLCNNVVQKLALPRISAVGQ